MRLLFIIGFTSALTSTATAALGKLGFNMGASRNTDGWCKSTTDWKQELKILSPYTNLIRVYAMSDCYILENLHEALVETNFQAVLGVWPNDQWHFSHERNALQAYLPKLEIKNVHSFIVGSEALYRKDMTPAQLVDRIWSIKTLLADIKDKNGVSYASIPVGFADSWGILTQELSRPVIQASDIIFANAFSYWQSQLDWNSHYTFFESISRALEIVQSIKQIQGVSALDYQFWVGETGWPTNGTNFGASVPSLQNADDYWQKSICAIRAWGINLLAFEAFDEKWKPDSAGISGTEKFWGIFNDDGTPKYNLGCDF